jgi:hypothetical protein
MIGLIQTMDYPATLAQATTTTDIWMRYRKAAELYYTASGDTAKAAQVTDLALIQGGLGADWLDSLGKYFGADPQASNVKALLRMNNALTDEVGNTWTDNGVSYNTESQEGSHSLYAFGTNNPASLSMGTLGDFMNADFTVELWLYHTASANAYGRFLQTRDNDSYAGLSIGYDTTDKFVLAMDLEGVAGWTLRQTVAHGLAAGCWHHIAVTRSGTAVNLWVNGVSLISGTVSGGLYYNASDIIVVGNQLTGVSRPPNAHIDLVRITDAVARYTAPFTPPVNYLPLS